jgi:ABC-type Na+ efflux pump permease subunit
LVIPLYLLIILSLASSLLPVSGILYSVLYLCEVSSVASTCENMQYLSFCAMLLFVFIFESMFFSSDFYFSKTISYFQWLSTLAPAKFRVEIHPVIHLLINSNYVIMCTEG